MSLPDQDSSPSGLLSERPPDRQLARADAGTRGPPEARARTADPNNGSVAGVPGSTLTRPAGSRSRSWRATAASWPSGLAAQIDSASPGQDTRGDAA